MSALIQKTPIFSTFSFIILIALFLHAPQTVAQEWTPVEIETDANLHSVYFIDRNTGWVAGGGGTIFHTSDGGENWTRQDSRTSEQLNQAYFFDEFTGWIAANNNLILTTQNGGELWAERRPSPVAGQHILDVRFPDWKRGWAAGGPGGHIYYTVNGGLSWQRQANLTPDSIITSIQYQNHQAAKVIYGNRIHHTSDGGSDWNETYRLTEHASFNASDLSFANDTAGLAVGSHEADGVILRTDDGGKNWIETERIPNRKLQAVAFPDHLTAYVAGSRGLLMQTENGGKTWTEVHTGTETGLNGIHFPDPGSGWIAGDNGTLLHLNASGPPDIAYYKNQYPSVQIADESEAFDLLKRSERYGTAALEKESPEKRIPHYGRMVASIEQAEPYFNEGQNEISVQISQLITYFWGNENNEGAKLFNQSLEQENSRKLAEKAKIHLQNAAFIQPDSTQSLLSLSYVNEALNDIPAAISAMEKAIDLMETPKTDHLKYLIDLYIYEGRNRDALEASTIALEHYPEEQSFYEVAADIHLTTGNTEEALPYLNGLTENNPEKPHYYYVRGSNLRELAISKLDSVLEVYDQIWERRNKLYSSVTTPSERNTLESEIEKRSKKAARLEATAAEYADQAASDLKKVAELNPDREVVHGLLGMFYYNRAAILHELRELRLDAEESLYFDSQIDTHLEQARIYLERAVDNNPDMELWWEALYNIYIDKGMTKEAGNIIDAGRF